MAHYEPNTGSDLSRIAKNKRTGSFVSPAIVAIVAEIIKQVDTPYNVGYVVGQVLYEVAEGAATVGVAKAVKSPKYALMIKKIISRIEKIDCIKDKAKIISKLEHLVPAAKHIDDVPTGNIGPSSFSSGARLILGEAWKNIG